MILHARFSRRKSIVTRRKCSLSAVCPAWRTWARPSGNRSLPFDQRVNGGRWGSGEVFAVAAGAWAVRLLGASYDDGRTWRSAAVTRERGGWVATLHHPAG